MITNNYSAPNYQSYAYTAPHKNTNDEILQTIARGKIGKGQKKQLEQEMAIITNNLTNKKRHSRKKNKYHQDAKFSSDSEHQHLSQNEYITSIKQKDNFFVVGSLLTLGTYNLVVYRDRGRFDLQVKVLTQQSHKIILTQLFDPGFSKLSIKKDKHQQQIINYLKQSTKPYKYLICWFQAVDGSKNQSLKQIAHQANSRKRILGWQSDHVKSHIMSIRQFKQIKRFKFPQKASSKSATCFNDERLLMIVQYPQKIQKIRQLYQPFKLIEKVPEEFYAIFPFCEGETAQDRFALSNFPHLSKPVFQEIAYQGWKTDQPNFNQTQEEQSKPTKSDKAIEPVALPSPTDRITQIRLHFGFSLFEEILTDEQEQPPKDLATELLDSIKSLPIINPLMNPIITPPIPSLGQTLFPGYNREYQSNPQIYPNNYWTNYSAQYHPNGQAFYPQQYNYLPQNKHQGNHYPQYSQRKDYFQPPMTYNPTYRREPNRHPMNNQHPYNY